MDVREKLVELFDDFISYEYNTEELVDDLIAHGVTVQSDCAELKKAMNRLGQFGRLFVDYQGCPRGRNGRAGVPLEEEVFLIPKITDVDGGEWIPVNADALHELVEQFKKLREISRQTPASVQNVPETNVGKWISVKDRTPTEADGTVWACLADLFPYNEKEPYIDAKHDRRITEAFYSQFSKRWYKDGAALPDGVVTHWMEKAQPPKGE